MRVGNPAALSSEAADGSSQPSQMELASPPKEGRPSADTLKAVPRTEMQWQAPQWM